MHITDRHVMKMKKGREREFLEEKVSSNPLHVWFPLLQQPQLLDYSLSTLICYCKGEHFINGILVCKEEAVR